VTDVNDFAVSTVLHQRVDGEVAPISYYCRLLNAADRKHSTYEKECLAVIFCSEKCRIYLAHKEFKLHCENLPFCWLLKRVKDVGRPGRMILPLAPTKYRVKTTHTVDNVVADALSRIF